MPVMAYTSSNFLISQLAYKNHDYETSLFDFNIDTAKYPNNDLLDKLIAFLFIWIAVIIYLNELRKE